MQALFSFILKLVGMEGFEPTQAEPPVLQTGPIHHHWSIPLCAYPTCVKFCDKRLSYLGITGIEFSLIESIERVMPKLSNICPHMLFPLKSNS